MNRPHLLVNLEESKRGTWTNGIGSFSTHNFGMFTTNFGYKGERRCFHAFIDCDNDLIEYTHIGGVIFNLGCWGSSDEIMRLIIDELKTDYPMWYVYDDSKDEEAVFVSCTQ